MYKRLTHIGIAVRDLDHSTTLFSKLLGEPVDHVEQVSDQHVKAAFFRIGDAGVELLEPTTTDSPIARFIEKRGEGVHHLSFEVDSIDSEIARLKQEGFRLIDEMPRQGADGYRIAFLHPKSTNGVLIEISEKVHHHS
jgi:methylmalonyl-CoA/ethylmalonyl-CoA epimerase